MGRHKRGVPPTPPSTPRPDALRVRVVDGPDRGRSAVIPAAGSLSIGSGTHAGLRVRDEGLAPLHVQLSIVHSGIALKVLAGAAMAAVGGLQIAEGVVPLGTRLQIADTTLALTGAHQSPRRQLLDSGFVFDSPRMQRIAETVIQLAPFPTDVLIEGETGTGKELIAQALHRASLRCNGPFVIVDCAAVPDNLITSELFGHERGSFTGADRRTEGAFARAHGGTLFLDEIGELSASAQSALLGVLQRRSFQRVGGHKTVKVDIRVVAATNRMLDQEVTQGRFRQDLYYRLVGGQIFIPPLRERTEDLPALVRHILAESNALDQLELIDEAGWALLRGHSWPGNVRELKIVIERLKSLQQIALVTGRGEQQAQASTPDEAEQPVARIDPDGVSDSYRDARASVIQAFERSYLKRLIDSCEGNASKAARVAQMDRPHLLKLLRRHGLR